MADPAPLLWPRPALVEWGARRSAVEPVVAVQGALTPRLLAVARRLVGRWPCPAGTTVPPIARGVEAPVVVAAQGTEPDLPQLGGHERYELRARGGTVRIDAPTPLGAARAIETLLQLLDGPGPGVPDVAIADAPRFPWRGLLLDVSRHWMPVDILRRTIDVMAAVKLNVLHLHLTDDQAFRFETKAFPALHEAGSGGRFYTQAQLRGLVDHAADRAVRIVPEIDVPGHVTSWLVAMPELAATTGPFRPRREFGIAPVALDPANDRVYEVLDVLLGELATVFPDEFVHLGGDEVDAAAWPHLPDARAAQAEFTARVVTIARAHGRRVVIWDEALHRGLPPDVVVQAWRGARALQDAVAAGHDALLSAGWYLDHLYAARHLHRVDPLGTPAEVAALHQAIEQDPGVAGISQILGAAHAWQRDGLRALTSGERRHVLGGEACMWTELVDERNLDGRLWPRTAAVADRLWAPASARCDDLDAHLARVGSWLERSAGSTHRSARLAALREMAAGDPEVERALLVLTDALEPVKWYTRLFADLPVELAAEPPDRSGGGRHYTTATPLDRLVDVTPPESAAAAELDRLVPAVVADPAGAAAARLAALARRWRHQLEVLEPSTEPRVREVLPLARDLAGCATVVDACLGARQAGARLAGEAASAAERDLAAAAAPCAELWLAVIPPLRRLMVVASSS